MQTSSVSKGCFVFKPKKKKKSVPLNSGDFFSQFQKESAASSKLRCDTYEDQWERMQDDIGDLQKDVNEKIFNDMLEFVQKAHKDFSLGPTADGEGKQFKRCELPTAALITGVNVLDHSAIYMSLTSMLKSSVSPHVIGLSAKKCHTLKSLMSSLIGQFMGAEDAVSSEEEEEGLMKPDLKRIPCTMQVLSAWYQDTLQRTSPSRKRSASSSERNFPQFPSLVVIFEDLESFQPLVLQDFIQICSEYLTRLPLIFVFGIATAVTAIHRILPQSVSSLLSIEKFQAPHSSVSLTKLMQKVLLTPNHPFKLGSKVFQFLLDLFLYHDFSFVNFVKGLQFCMMEHFFEEPLSMLCCDFEEAVQRLKQLTHKQLELCRSKMSFRRYVEAQNPKEQRALLLDDDHLKSVMLDLLEMVEEYHQNFYPILLCLHCLTHNLPHHPLGKQVREIYANALDGHICEHPGYKEAVQLLRLYAKDELISHLASCLDILTVCNTDVLKQIRAQLEMYKGNLEKLGDSGYEPVEENGYHDNDDGDVKKAENSQSAQGSEKTTLHSLQQKLMKDAKKKKKPTRYEALRQQVLDYLHEVFMKILIPPQSLTFHEIFYYNSLSDVRQRLNASPRAAIHTALSDPNNYLQSETCKMTSDTITSDLPDVCIAYKLHLECGRLINLYDWLQAFVTVVGDDEEAGENEDEQKPDQIMQARFIRAVSELQFLGFVKPTRRKTDHVSRLTWGGC